MAELIKTLWKSCSKVLPDWLYISLEFKKHIGYFPNLRNPQTFNEKLQWLKLHDRKPIYTTMVDKFEAKKYVADIIGEEYIIPTLGVWDHFDDIDFDSLPEQFVLKCTHDSAGIVIVKNKNDFCRDAAKEKLEARLKQNFYYSGREWPYKNVKPRLIAEKYMEDAKTREIRDYKFFCFDGVAKALFIASDRQKEDEETKFDFFDMEFNHLEVKNGHPFADPLPEKPERFDEMRELAEKLSQKIPHLRVDFYEINGKAYFGELTFFQNSGFVPIEPESWDKELGTWIKLPESYRGTR